MGSFERIFDFISQNSGKATVIVINNLNDHRDSAVPAQRTLSNANKKLYIPRAGGKDILVALGALGAVSRETAQSKSSIAEYIRTEMERRNSIKVKYLRSTYFFEHEIVLIESWQEWQGWYANARLVEAGYVQLTPAQDLFLTFKGLQLVDMLEDNEPSIRPARLRPAHRRVSALYVLKFMQELKT
jgi:hypothetical protein